MAAKESAEKLNSTPFPSLEYLDLSNCEIDGEGVKALSQLLLSGSNGHNNGDQRKITLDLNSNPIGSDACQSLSSLCSPRLDKDSIIKSLSLKKCSIGDDGFQVFAKGLLGKSCGGLCKLDLTGNGFGPKGLIDFADAMKTGLRDLRDLCLADNSVKEEGVIALSSALRDNNLNLSVVDLSNTHCGSLGAKSILQCNTLSSIRLFNNNLGCAGFEVIGSLLEEGNSSVSHLDIGGNRAKNGAVAALLRVILQIGDTGLSNLHTLELGGNEIGEEVESVLKDLQEKRPGLDIPRDRPNVEQPANMQP
jgi:Ran GTPase-activating protein (RanGAP) involved in mRNA processing and transport